MYYVRHYNLYCQFFVHGERQFHLALDRVVVNFLGNDVAGRIVCSTVHPALNRPPDQRCLIIWIRLFADQVEY